MKTLTFYLILLFAVVPASAQTLRVTFSAAGESDRIDWITATNLTTNGSITFPGNETLSLNFIYPGPGANGIKSILHGYSNGVVYPNPFQGNATVKFDVKNSQNASITVRNLSGQTVAQTYEYVEAGENYFMLNLASEGIYIITLTTGESSSIVKAVCHGSSGLENSVRYLGISGKGPDSGGSGLKSHELHFSLNLAVGDVVVYRCMAGNTTTLFTDVPEKSKNYNVWFYACTDRHGKDYQVVNIGDQTWMAENLAWLPSVTSSYEGSINYKKYYVYGYQDNNIDLARKTKNYTEYGVLYNWVAAKYACPMGWRLPSDSDWKTLEKFLGMEETSVEETGWRLSGTVGKKLKEGGTTHWVSPNSEASNEAGFTARPGGIRLMPFPGLEENDGSNGSRSDGPYGTFSNLGECGIYWTSSVLNQSTAWSRRFGCVEGGLERTTNNKGLGFSVRCIKVKPER